VILAGMTGEVQQKQKEMITRARDRVDGLLHLINDWLDVAKLNAGQIVDKLRPLSLKKLIKKLIEDMQPLAQGSDVSLEFGDSSEHDLVQGDEETLEQVFANLITNAIRYNKPKGRVIINIREDKDSISTEVQDTGIGISQEHLPFIFDQFYRVKRGEGQKIKGTGLGLSIAKKIVEAHGGTIKVSSEPGKGSTFAVILAKAKKDTLSSS
jgi:two-component system sensor histidine kinase/response regulator